MGVPTKSVMRMFGPSGNPTAKNLLLAISSLKETAHISLNVRADRADTPAKDEIIIGIYDTAAHADAAVSDLKTAGVPDTAISLYSGTNMAVGTTSTIARDMSGTQPLRLFSGETEFDSAVYDRSLESGSTVVKVRSPNEHVTRVMEILESHNPVDVDERTAGKRVVNKGGVRVRRYVIKTPVNESVSLRDETVTLGRWPVADERPLEPGELSEKVIEMTASAEEAVTAKTARVYEEVGLRKEVVDRTKYVKDTMRKEKAAVEQVSDTSHSDPLRRR